MYLGTNHWRLGLTGLLLCIPASARQDDSKQSTLVSSCSMSALCDVLGARIVDRADSHLTEWESAYRLELPSGERVDLLLGVFTSVERAAQAYRRHLMIPQIAGKPARLGDESMQWTPGSVLFRRANVVCSLSPNSSLRQGLHSLALRIDRGLASGGAIASYCEPNAMPAIESLDFPTRIERSRERPYELGDRPESWPRFTLKLRNVGSLDDVRVVVGGAGITNHVRFDGSPRREFHLSRADRQSGDSPYRPARPDEDGRFMLNPGHGGEIPEGKQRVSVIVVTPGNLILTRDVEVEIVPAD